MKKILLLFALFGCFFGFSQEKEDPTVGLVLSGGGAKGLAHIGALKVIEARRPKQKLPNDENRPSFP